jgi:mxaA protein
MRRVSLALGLLLALAHAAAAEVRGVYTIEPRAFGYFLGDTFARTVEIETGAEDEIVPSSLPRSGASTYWLELRAIAHSSEPRGDGRLHRLTLTYQTFYAPIDPRKVTVPATEIAVRGPAGTETATIPSFTLITSPLREIFPEKSGETAETFLLPDAKPAMRRSGSMRTAALCIAALSGLLLLLLARDLAWWPFSRRPARPFSRAVREIRHALASGSEGYRSALLALHRAFDRAAGHRLLADDVGGFLDTHPEHRAIGAEVERFFAASRAVFFGESGREGEIRLPPTELKELAATLARQERSAK